MQSDFFFSPRPLFPCLVRRAHIITGWRENNGQKIVRARAGRGDGLRKNDKKKAERKKTDITIRPAA